MRFDSQKLKQLIAFDDNLLFRIQLRPKISFDQKIKSLDYTLGIWNYKTQKNI